MHTRSRPEKIGFLTALVIFLMFPLCSDPPWAASTHSERVAFQQSIIDKRYALNRHYKKVLRKKTEYIIVHTSEAGLQSTLNTVSGGKCLRGSGRRTCGGHAHYVIARDGRTYRMLDKEYIADHAGLSMWNGETNLSQVSIGIELVGYHYTPITPAQYKSIAILLDILKRVYGLDDKAILTHAQVAYGRPNRWLKESHRGRKKCAKNFDRAKAGLGPTWPYDPDVRAGRVVADDTLAAIFYRPGPAEAITIGSNVITASNTAWAIAGDDYDAPTTLYRLPSGEEIPGDQIDSKVGWSRLPEKTIVLLNQEETTQAGINQGPVKTISDGLTAWALAGSAYKHQTTYYFFPNGGLKNGRQVSDWDDLPTNTRIIIGYKSPQTVTLRTPPLRIVGDSYNQAQTLYYFPDHSIVPGDQIQDFTKLPKGVRVFIPIETSS
jgi:N-acetylmuramoyl-L-alanine amidase